MLVDAKIEQKVFVLDDEPKSRKEIGAVVASMAIPFAEYSNAKAFLAEFDADQRGCIIADMGLKGSISGVELIEHLAQSGCEMPSILLTGLADTSTIVRVMRNGAVNVLDKPVDASVLADAIRDALRIDSVNRKKRSRVTDLQFRFSQLTDQERTVLQLIVEGKINKQISRFLDVSVRTVESRRHHIFRKTGARNVGQLIWQAMMLRSEGHDLFSTLSARDA